MRLLKVRRQESLDFACEVGSAASLGPEDGQVVELHLGGRRGQGLAQQLDSVVQCLREDHRQRMIGVASCYLVGTREASVAQRFVPGGNINAGAEPAVVFFSQPPTGKAAEDKAKPQRVVVSNFK